MCAVQGDVQVETINKEDALSLAVELTERAVPEERVQAYLDVRCTPCPSELFDTTLLQARDGDIEVTFFTLMVATMLAQRNESGEEPSAADSPSR